MIARVVIRICRVSFAIPLCFIADVITLAATDGLVAKGSMDQLRCQSSRQFSDRPTGAILRVLIAVVGTGGGMLLLVFPVQCCLEFAAMQKQCHFRYIK